MNFCAYAAADLAGQVLGVQGPVGPEGHLPHDGAPLLEPQPGAAVGLVVELGDVQRWHQPAERESLDRLEALAHVVRGRLGAALGVDDAGGDLRVVFALAATVLVFALGLALLQGILPMAELDASFKPRATISAVCRASTSGLDKITSNVMSICRSALVSWRVRLMPLGVSGRSASLA